MTCPVLCSHICCSIHTRAAVLGIIGTLSSFNADGHCHCELELECGVSHSCFPLLIWNKQCIILVVLDIVVFLRFLSRSLPLWVKVFSFCLLVPSLSWTFLHGAHRFWSGKVWRKDTKALVKQHLLDGTPYPGKCSCHLGVRKNLCAIHVPQVLKGKLHVVSARLTDKILSFSPADPDRAAVRWTVNKEDLLWAGFVS